MAVVGTTAYVPQTPFILGGTVRDNILFGRPYQEDQYRVAVQAAQLEPDLAQLPAGDMTELGEWGLVACAGHPATVIWGRRKARSGCVDASTALAGVCRSCVYSSTR